MQRSVFSLYTLSVALLSALMAVGCSRDQSLDSSTRKIVLVEPSPVPTPIPPDPFAGQPLVNGQSPVNVGAPETIIIDNSAVLTNSDQQWADSVFKFMPQWGNARNRYIRASQKHAYTALTNYIDCLTQLQRRLDSAPRTDHMGQAHDLIAQGVSQTLEGAKLSQTVANWPANTPHRNDEFARGSIAMGAGDKLISSGFSTADATLSQIKKSSASAESHAKSQLEGR